MKKQTIVTTALSALILSFSLNASAASTGYMKMPGIPGESRLPMATSFPVATICLLPNTLGV